MHLLLENFLAVKLTSCLCISSILSLINDPLHRHQFTRLRVDIQTSTVYGNFLLQSIRKILQAISLHRYMVKFHAMSLSIWFLSSLLLIVLYILLTILSWSLFCINFSCYVFTSSFSFVIWSQSQVNHNLSKNCSPNNVYGK